MSVRAKFKLESYTTCLTQKQIDPHKGFHPENMRQVELRTLTFMPVYGNGDPNHANTKFSVFSPTGKVELGTVNPDVWKNFELGKEYYLYFTPAA